ncbi:hemerythrin domain-containing protein [Ferribacterium limneticum]|uniref:hemerythrin domain-containing protein n=1 Tax=Ferribacterium limneticum TaxID=76259 RepID=UPI001CFA6872|nr:hemerythrin domain-containing protein [Ferribacterium limneticum]UCV27420.1 hemerythrin domain-containing protein [Ferribacterium limneticum]UCV31337.1 hemerythrin domain-containing protein [Ferribacterium limneticum]
MTTIRSYMTDDHRHCDDLFAEAEQAVGKGNLDLAQATFGHFRSAVLAHFNTEEKTLFPTFEAKTGMTMGPTQVMRMEHVQMRALMEESADALKAGNTEDYLGLADTLLIMMQQHNMKEENMLYPMCDQHLTAELPAILERLETELHEE